MNEIFPTGGARVPTVFRSHGICGVHTQPSCSVVNGTNVTRMRLYFRQKFYDPFEGRPVSQDFTILAVAQNKSPGRPLADLCREMAVGSEYYFEGRLLFDDRNEPFFLIDSFEYLR